MRRRIDKLEERNALLFIVPDKKIPHRFTDEGF